MDDQGQQPQVPGGSGMPVSEPQQPAASQPSVPPTGGPTPPTGGEGPQPGAPAGIPTPTPTPSGVGQ